LPADLLGHGKTDLFVSVNGALSNVVRIDCGAPHEGGDRGEPRGSL
jgi:hypothetical protein